MKKIILCLVLNWMSLMVLGQENFEGVVVYQNRDNKTTNNISKLVAYFKENFIRVTSYKKVKIGELDTTIKEKEILVDLKNGFAYNFQGMTNLVFKDSIINDKLFNEGKVFLKNIDSEVKILGQECIVTRIDSTNDITTNIPFIQNLEFFLRKKIIF